MSAIPGIDFFEEYEAWPRDGEPTRAEVRDLVVQHAETVARLATARAERDVLAEEVGILRGVVSASLWGSGQERANAYAALIRFDARRRAETLRGTE